MSRPVTQSRFRIATPLVWIALCLAATLALADEQAEADAASEHTNTVKWSTTGEVNNFGFDVYRAESEEGPFERITPEPLIGAGTTHETHHYQFVDLEIDPYKTYWYYVESLAVNGRRDRITPTFAAKPKRERDAQERPERHDPEPDKGDSGSR